MRDGAFPEGFLWGTATSAHQVEGDNELNDWAEWERTPGRIRDGSAAGSAAEWWRGRAEQDLRGAAALGQNAHRLSIEWSRLEPEPGKWDDGAERRYREILLEARASGLSLMLTLNHFTLPAWLARRGSWLASEAPAAFGRFAARAVRAFGEHTDLWVTLNEPNVLVYMAYVGTRWPPGLGSMRAGQWAFPALLEAHARASSAIHAARPGSRVGIVLSLPAFEAAEPRNKRDEAVAAIQSWSFGGALLRALHTGWVLPPLVLTPRRLSGLARSFDWLGVNYYGKYPVEFDWHAYRELFGRRLTERSIRTEWTDWGQPDANALTRQLVHLQRYEVPLYVTENGLMDADDIGRRGFLVEHVRAVHAAIRRGTNVRGYFHWSLVDNFEWAEGWSAPFGLHALDRSTQARTLRPSGELYARICRENSVPSWAFGVR